MLKVVLAHLLSSSASTQGGNAKTRKALVQSKQRRYSAPHCSEELLARSYTLPPRWPWPAFHLVMEFTANTCDLYSSGATSFCSGMAALNPPSGGSGDPESHVTEALASFLSHCARSSCRSIDFGANNGWMTGYMLSAGSHVLAVEPSKDFARAITETGRLNCGWADRLTVRNVRACVKGMPEQSRETCLAPSTCGRCSCGGWRWGNTQGAPQIEVAHGERCAERFGLPANVSGLAFEDLVWEAAAGTGEIDLIKMDADGPEGSWLKALSVMLHGDRPLRVRTIIVEASNVDPRTMHHFQNKLGYTALRLDIHDARRHVTREGFDAYSAPGCIEPLDRLQEQHETFDRLRCKYSPPGPHRPLADNVSRTKLEDEWFAVRAMRHVFHIRPNTTVQGWTTIMQPVLKCSYPLQYVLTLETADELLPEVQSLSPGEHDSPERCRMLGYDQAPCPRCTARGGREVCTHE